MGHKGRLLETECGRWRGKELRVCPAPEPRATNLPSGPHLTPNGVGGITPVLLRGVRNSMRCGTGLLQSKTGLPFPSQIHALCDWK
jgi:hypothetical protein